MADGSFFGTLCAIDPKPRRLNTPEVIGMFKLFAELIAFHLDAADKVEVSESKLALEQRSAELREQFIAVLGHDLRNPLASIAGGLRLLRKKVDAEGGDWLTLMQVSVNRMAGLIDNVMDFARARLGGGIQLKLREESLEPHIKQIISEFENVHPNRLITSAVDIPGKVKIDAGRINQLLSNLLGNALAYGDPNAPITVTAKANGRGFEISVANEGRRIPDEAMPLLFTAFHRGEVLPNEKGLGLGLYISQEIAHAHGGEIRVASTAEQTVFTAEFPLALVDRPSD
jgi:signal transduction histidine kinase